MSTNKPSILTVDLELEMWLWENIENFQLCTFKSYKTLLQQKDHRKKKWRQKQVLLYWTVPMNLVMSIRLNWTELLLQALLTVILVPSSTSASPRPEFQVPRILFLSFFHNLNKFAYLPIYLSSFVAFFY